MAGKAKGGNVLQQRTTVDFFEKDREQKREGTRTGHSLLNVL